MHPRLAPPCLPFAEITDRHHLPDISDAGDRPQGFFLHARKALLNCLPAKELWVIDLLLSLQSSYYSF